MDVRSIPGPLNSFQCFKDSLGHLDNRGRLFCHCSRWVNSINHRSRSRFILVVHSLNHVRLPIGYWAFDVSGDEPFIQGQVDYLQKAASWTQAHGLKLIIDLHGSYLSEVFLGFVLTPFHLQEHLEVKMGLFIPHLH